MIPPSPIGWFHCVDAWCAGFELVTSKSDLVGACQIISNLRITSEHSNSFERERKSKREIERDRETERDKETEGKRER